ncbi:HipA domain-containing protein [Cupriavidus sp. 2TAF22]|uniref:HipA domain-containing protein n=1 Tax=unclassified Cupriavidus TaxID=2640874 RepID=UPI003F9304F2
MAERSLLASINGQKVGRLDGSQDIWSFQYDEAWLSNAEAFQLSPALPLQTHRQIDGGTNRAIQWFFDNLLPEEAQRSLMARDAGIKNEADAFALLAYYGSESAGSLTLLGQGKDPAEPELRALPDDVLEGRIRALPRVPLTHDALKKMSLAGAQHKLAIVVRDAALLEPGGNAPSTHILKPDHQDADDYPHSVINEWFVMSLAAQLGLAVPTVSRRYVPSPVYLIRRFDRQEKEGNWGRLHSIDACQMLNLSRTFKYDQGSIESLSRLANMCRSPALERPRLFDWLVFNLLVGNADAHLKNLSFLVSANGIALAPFYDLLSETVYSTRAFDKQLWPDVRLAWPIQGREFFRDIDRTVMIEAGRELGLTARTAERRLDVQLRSIMPAAAALHARAEDENAELLKQRPDLAATFGGEMRCLRAIQHNIIADMTRQLA